MLLLVAFLPVKSQPTPFKPPVHPVLSAATDIPIENNEILFKALGDFQSLIIPLRRAGKLILIDAVVDSMEGNLIFDTGSAGLVLNSMYFRSTRRAGGQTSGGITGTVEAVSKRSIRRLQLSEVRYEKIEADMADLGHLERARGVKILGLFGLALFREFEVVLDLRNNLLELHRLDKKGKHLNGLWQPPLWDVQIAVSNQSNVLFMEGQINSKRMLFCLDTGAESNVLSQQLPDKVLNTVDITSRTALRGVGAQQVIVFHGIMNDFAIGGHTLTGMPVMVTNLSAMSHAFGISLDGMLGCDFFEKGVFYINMRHESVGIQFYKNEK